MNALPRQFDRRLLIVGVLFIGIAATPLSGLLTETMVGHVLIQIPLLVAIGFGFGRWLEPRVEKRLRHWNAGGIPGIVLVSFVLAFWMIPRWLDAALTNGVIEWAKYASLVVLAGIPLALSWFRLHPIARGVVKIEFLSMLFRLGWLYLISPDRFCNNYLLTDQLWLGRGMIIVAIALSITWMIPVFFGNLADSLNPPNTSKREPPSHLDPKPKLLP